MAKISVIIPAYNVENYIEKTLKSLTLQTFKDFEVIIVNDGSTDNTENQVRSILRNVDFPWKLLNQQNQGVSVARNNGLIQENVNNFVFLNANIIMMLFFLKKCIIKPRKMIMIWWCVIIS